MIVLQSRVEVAGISGQDIWDFLLNATDRDYQEWWPGVHLQYHTLKRHPNNVGNTVFMDEFIGDRRVCMTGIVTEAVPGERIVWQLKKLVRLPVWLILDFADSDAGVSITHTIRAGYGGVAKVLDPAFRLFFSDTFAASLDAHVKAEFPMLRDMLARASPSA